MFHPMILSPVRRLLLALVFTIAGAAKAAEPAIIALARAHYGPDAVLDAVQSVHYVGTLVGPDPADATKQLTQTIEIYLQKPAQQRIEVRSATVIEVSALDGYDAWRRTIDAKNPTVWQQTLMAAEQVRQLRADVWQNLYYFRGIEKVGGSVEDLGTERIDGKTCRKIAFHHGDTVVNFRSFDEATGKLVYTGSPQYNTREQGEIIAGGIRFPKTLTITQTAPDGRLVVRTLTFDKITVNEKFRAGLFSVPLANANN